jgi:uncharacterized protein
MQPELVHHGIPDSRLANQSIPISVYVVKVASRCNLNCGYCYMYNLGDTTYRAMPKVMPLNTSEAMFLRIRDHAVSHSLDEILIILHGGEPLLAGVEYIDEFARLGRKILEPEVRVRYSMQTNGTLLSHEWLEVLGKHSIGFGISLDGPEIVHDLHRVDHKGNGSYRQVEENIRMVLSHPRYSALFGSVLTVINHEIDPSDLLNHYVSLGITGADFLLPDMHYETAPASILGGMEVYGKWLARLYDTWISHNNPSFKIRIFENIIGRILGASTGTDSLGAQQNNILVIETDGGIEPVDVLKACGDGFTKTGLSVLHNKISDIERNSLARIYHQGSSTLCERCKACPVVAICSGGYLPHRYSIKTGFDNPSVYCHDLYYLIRHIQNHVISQLPESLKLRHSLAPLPKQEQFL